MRNKIFLILAFVFLMLFSIVFIMKNKTEVIVESPEEGIDWTQEDFSRLSFFNTSDERMTISLPERWEGMYRMKEEGARVVFYYLSSDAQATKMFSIRKSQEIDGDRVVCEHDDYRYFLELYDFDAPGLVDLEAALNYIFLGIKCG